MKRKKSSFSNQKKKKKIKFFDKIKEQNSQKKKVEYSKKEKDFDNLLFKYGLKTNFSSKSIKELDRYKKIDYENIYKKRKDLTSNFIITIDGDNAKDFDDAISLSTTGGMYKLGVHIADVSFYVGRDSAIDKDAFERGCSVYLINQVIPMLPFELSNDLCSLVQGKKRLTLTCDMEINNKGEIYNYEFYSSVIESRRRTTYKEVDSILDNKLDLGKEFKDFVHLCNDLKNILHKKRISEGAINIDSSEIEFKIGEKDKVETIFSKQRLNSETIIEEFMLVANKCAANFLKRNETGIFRIHEPPKIDKLELFEKMVLDKGYVFPKGGSVNPLIHRGKNRYQIFLEQIKDDAERKIFSYYLLTSLSKAIYFERNIGHYGLAFKSYTHFTSPIRRYPDLIVHRLISKILASKAIVYKKKEIASIAKKSSHRERLSIDAEREYVKIKSMRYLEDKIGQTFNCIISGKTEYGYFLREVKTSIDGFHEIPYYDKKNSTKEVGDSVKAILTSLDFKRIHINFRIKD